VLQERGWNRGQQLGNQLLNIAARQGAEQRAGSSSAKCRRETELGRTRGENTYNWNAKKKDATCKDFAIREIKKEVVKSQHAKGSNAKRDVKRKCERKNSNKRRQHGSTVSSSSHTLDEQPGNIRPVKKCIEQKEKKIGEATDHSASQISSSPPIAENQPEELSPTLLESTDDDLHTSSATLPKSTCQVSSKVSSRALSKNLGSVSVRRRSRAFERLEALRPKRTKKRPPGRRSKKEKQQNKSAAAARILGAIMRLASKRAHVKKSQATDDTAEGRELTVNDTKTSCGQPRSWHLGILALVREGLNQWHVLRRGEDQR
jgi:hypothetical protein